MNTDFFVERRGIGATVFLFKIMLFALIMAVFLALPGCANLVNGPKNKPLSPDIL